MSDGFADLTSRERQVIDALYAFIVRRGYPPTALALAGCMDVPTIRVRAYLGSLVAHGLVAKRDGDASVAFVPVRLHNDGFPIPSQGDAAVRALIGYGKFAALLGADPAVVGNFLDASRDLIQSIAHEDGDKPRHDPQDRDRRAAEWLSLSAPSSSQAKDEWKATGAAWLQAGQLFAAIAIPADLLHSLFGTDDPGTVADLLQVLRGPVFFTRDEESWYTALMPPGVQATWRVPPTTVSKVGDPHWVPVPGGGPGDGSTRWVVPILQPGALGSPALLASLIAVALQRAPRRKDFPSCQ